MAQGVIAGNLIDAPAPIYPPIAKAARVEGTVVLHALISKQGSIEDLNPVSGPPMLIDAAMVAVKRWRYKPYLLGGKAVEVETTINVNFGFGNPQASAAPPDNATQLRGAADGELDYAIGDKYFARGDYPLAFASYKKAGDEGYKEGYRRIGDLYETEKLGIGGAASRNEAMVWYKMAAGTSESQARQADTEPQPSAATEDATREQPQPTGVPAPAPFAERGFSSESTPDAAGPNRPSPAVPIPHNYALIFATDDYAHWPHLTNPIPDADAVNEALASLYGFHVDEVKNPSSEQVLLKLSEYLHRKFQPQDQLLIFFSGHGYFDDELGQGFIVPADAPLVQNDPTHRSLLAYDDIMRYINRIPATHIVLMADACFAGTLDRRIADGAMRGNVSDVYAHATLPELLARKETKRTRRYFASGGKDFVPDGLPGHHSPFISAFLVTLNQAADRKGYLTLDDIQQGLETVTPEPKWGDIQQDNDPGADFLLLTSQAVAKLSQANSRY